MADRRPRGQAGPERRQTRRGLSDAPPAAAAAPRPFRRLKLARALRRLRVVCRHEVVPGAVGHDRLRNLVEAPDCPGPEIWLPWFRGFDEPGSLNAAAHHRCSAGQLSRPRTAPRDASPPSRISASAPPRTFRQPECPALPADCRRDGEQAPPVRVGASGRRAGADGTNKKNYLKK